MANPSLSSGILYIDRDRDVLSGQWGPYVKIGIVRNNRTVAERNKQHQTGNPRRIEPIFSLDAPMVDSLEKRLHSLFADLRIIGEWFIFDDVTIAKKVIPTAKEIIEEQILSKNTFERRLELKDHISSGVMRKPTIKEKKLYDHLINARHDLIIKKAHLSIHKNNLIKIMGSAFGIDGVIECQTRIRKSVLQKNLLKAEHPNIFAEYEIDVLNYVTSKFVVKGTLPLSKLDKTLDARVKASKLGTEEVTNTSRVIIKRDASIEDHHTNYLQYLGQVSEAEWQVEKKESEMANIIGDDDGLEDLIQWKRESTQETKFDTAKFIANEPALAKEFLSTEKSYTAMVILPGRPYSKMQPHCDLTSNSPE